MIDRNTVLSRLVDTVALAIFVVFIWRTSSSVAIACVSGLTVYATVVGCRKVSATCRRGRRLQEPGEASAREASH